MSLPAWSQHLPALRWGLDLALRMAWLAVSGLPGMPGQDCLRHGDRAEKNFREDRSLCLSLPIFLLPLLKTYLSIRLSACLCLSVYLPLLETYLSICLFACLCLSVYL